MSIYLGEKNLIEVRTQDVLLSNPQRSGFTTQADANSYFAQKLAFINSSWGQLAAATTWAMVVGKDAQNGR
jgi:hypothetical protein